MAEQQAKFPILFLGTQMEIAGAQRLLLAQARWFHQRGYPVLAVFFYDKQGLAQTWQAQADFQVITLTKWNTGRSLFLNLFNFCRGLFRLFLLLRHRVKAIVTYTPHSNLVGLPIAWMVGVPVRVGTHHGYIEGSTYWLTKAHGWLTNSSMCSKMVAVSAQVSEYAKAREGARASKLVIIENGIEPLKIEHLAEAQIQDIRSQIGVRNEEMLLLTLGRLTKQKGHSILLEAISALKPGKQEPIFVFAGDGPLRNELEEKAKRLGIDEKVRFLGIRDDVNELLLLANIFVQPSLWEGLSLALLEALQAGLPVVATRVEGVVDVVEDGESALLVPPGDVQALAEAIERLLGDGELRSKLGRSGQERAQTRYSVERMCLAYEKLLIQLIQ